MRSGISVGVQELLRHSVRQQWRFCGVLWPQQWALGGAQPTWECWVLTCSSSKHWGRWTRALWSPSRAGLSLVGSPAQVGTCSELLREHCWWKQGCIKRWGMGTLPVPMKAATGQVVPRGWAALTVHSCQERSVSVAPSSWQSSAEPAQHRVQHGELSEQASQGASSCQVFAEGHNETEKLVLLCQAVLFTMCSSLQFLKDLERITRVTVVRGTYSRLAGLVCALLPQCLFLAEWMCWWYSWISWALMLTLARV